MKRFAGITLIVLGIVVVILGVLGTQLVQDLMPIHLPSSGETHTYLRWVPADPDPASAPSPFLAPALIIVGLIAVVVGARMGHRGAV